MNEMLTNWGEAAFTSIGFFWMALWAFGLGYLISSLIQVFVTEAKMKELMGKDKSKGVFIGTFFGFISSSCSFSALATTKSLFKKGAGFMASLAFLLSSTNLVIELGIIISVFLGWQFLVGEYVGGILLILFSWLLLRIVKAKKIIKEAREKLDKNDPMATTETNNSTFLNKLKSKESWIKVAKQYFMEWKMVWKDVTIGFTVAGIVAVFIPDQFFQSLFIGTNGAAQSFTFIQVMEHILIGPVVAFITFIGSMGNIPLAALLFGKGVSFGGVMAFIFSDLVVFPVLRINSKYYGWKMAFFILFLLFTSLILTSLLLHYGLNFIGYLPDPSDVKIGSMRYFEMDYSFYLNIIFILLSAGLIWYGQIKHKGFKYMKEMAEKGKLLENILTVVAILSYGWLIVGLFLKFM